MEFYEVWNYMIKYIIKCMLTPINHSQGVHITPLLIVMTKFWPVFVDICVSLVDCLYMKYLPWTRPSGIIGLMKNELASEVIDTRLDSRNEYQHLDIG